MVRDVSIVLGVPIIGVFVSNFRVASVRDLVIFVDKVVVAHEDLERDFIVDFIVDFKPDVRIDLRGVYD